MHIVFPALVIRAPPSIVRHFVLRDCVEVSSWGNARIGKAEMGLAHVKRGYAMVILHL